MKIEANLAIKTLSVEGAQTEQANKIIDGFFSVLGVKTTSFLQKNEVQKSEGPSVSTLKNDKNNSEAIQNSSKALPKIDHKRTLHVPIGELLDDGHSSKNVRELENGAKTYQTEYWCMCGHEGKRFIPKTNRYTKCHQCDMKLLIEPATLEIDENNIPLPDKSGNFYIAREAFEID